MIDLKKIYKSKEIVIYGAGSVSDLFYSYLFMNNLDTYIRAFIVSNVVGMPKKKHGIPVINAYEARILFPSATLFIAVHELTVADVLSNALKIGYKQPTIINANDIREIIYGKLYECPIDNNKILLMNYHGSGFGCNPKYIAEQLIKNDTSKKLDLVWAVNGKTINMPDRIRTVQIGTYDYYKELATARLWIDNVRKTEEVKKREGQFYLQTWHGAAPFKKVEGDLEGKASPAIIEMGKRDSEMVDLFISGSSFYSNLYRTSFWYAGEIFESGLPRQDIFWNATEIRKKVRKVLNISEGEIMVLYSPTFRDDGSVEYCDLNIKKLKEVIKKKYDERCEVCVSKHPLNINKDYPIDSLECKDVSMYEDFEELLVAADILITDYSGCVYDFSFSRKPVFLYQPDYKKMKLQRDFYVSPDKMPYPIAHNMKELTDSIMFFNYSLYKKQLDLFMKKFGNFDDGKASERVCERIQKILNQK